MSVINNGFLVIPFKLSTQPEIIEDTKHYLFVKKHSPKDEKEQNCLFCVNLPMLTDIDSLRNMVGKICNNYNTAAYIENWIKHEQFEFDTMRFSSLTNELSKGSESHYSPHNTSLLKFVDSFSFDNFWNALKNYSKNAKDSNLISWECNGPSITKFVGHYKPINSEYLKKDVFSHLKAFSESELAAQQEVQSSIMDADGFTLVVGKNTKSLDSIKKKILKKNPLSKYSTKTRAKVVLDKKSKQDFYRFQIRERKKIEITQLLAKFKEDQEKIKVMKQKRKFNPYSNNL